MGGVRLETFESGPLNDLVNGLATRPEDYYFDVHTDLQPDGSIRAQFGDKIGPPVIEKVVSANLDPAGTTLAPAN